MPSAATQTCTVLCLVPQSCLTLCDPMDCSPPGSSVQGDSPGKNTRVDCHFLLQGIFPTQGSNPCLLGLLHLVGRFFNTVPLGKFIILSEASQRKTNIICYRLYAESKKNNTIELIYKTETDSELQNELMVTMGRTEENRMGVWD